MYFFMKFKTEISEDSIRRYLSYDKFQSECVLVRVYVCMCQFLSLFKRKGWVNQVMWLNGSPQMFRI